MCPDLILHHFDCVAAFDHMQERAWIISATPDRADELEELLNARPKALGSHAIDRLAIELHAGSLRKGHRPNRRLDPGGRHLPGQHRRSVHGRAVPADFDPLAFYRAPAPKNPATFAAFLDYGAIQIASSSPERLLQLRRATVETRPIKGTQPARSRPGAGCAARSPNLLAEPQGPRRERDDRRSAAQRSVARLPSPARSRCRCSAGSKPTPPSITSSRSSPASCSPAMDAVDLIGAAFPGGSITGAPKIRAMEIIAEIEQAPRGVYCGAIGYIGFNGRMRPQHRHPHRCSSRTAWRASRAAAASPRAPIPRRNTRRA